jgi:enterochelin esterase-like enzyme/outer membrane protein assembly factor BamB
MRRQVTGILVCLVLGLLLVAPVAAAEWPGFRGPNWNGTVPNVRLFEGDSATLEVGWKRALGSGYSALAVADGRLVAMFADGDADYLGAFDADSGDEIWRYRIADTYSGHDGSHDGPISTPLIAGGMVFGLGAYGHLFGVNAETGEAVWTKHLVDDYEAKKPHYGFTTSPLMADGVLVVQIGAGEGKTIVGFNPESGEQLWSVGNDEIGYQSPIVAELGGRMQVVAPGKANLYGIEASSGKVLWSYEHGGDERAMGGHTIVPLPAGKDRLFVMNKIDASAMLTVRRSEEGWSIEESWSSNAIKQSYVTPVYHDGYIYGMSNRIFTCVDAATGEIQWRSREPGDGFPTIVGQHLVVMTKPGTLHVVDASPEGYRELASLDLFDEHSWSEVAFAGGNLYARSMAHVAKVSVGGSAEAGDTTASWVSRTGFGSFLDELEAASDKNAAIDAFIEKQSSFPIVEDNGAVHFLYRGDASDVGIVGDMIGFRREDPMTPVEGTDLFYWSTMLEPDAAVSYGFIVDFEEPAPDPLNSNAASGLFGDVSMLTMPAWDAPDFLGEADASRQGRLETVEWESEAREGQKREARVYLPAGYDADVGRRYPVLYVHNGNDALENGSLKNALDHLIGESVAPAIAVFVLTAGEDPRADLRQREPYAKMLVDELVPLIDEKFRTIPDSRNRATVGSGQGANIALFTAFNHADVFGRVGVQSATGVSMLREAAKGPDQLPMVIYMDWGTYHLRSPHEAWDLAEDNREAWSHLRAVGYRPAGGEQPEGYGWGCWNGHTDELLAAMFPLMD